MTLVYNDHYKSNEGVQPIDLILAFELNFCAGNVVKYVCRYKNKNGLEDLYKAREYLNWLIELEGW